MPVRRLKEAKVKTTAEKVIAGGEWKMLNELVSMASVSDCIRVEVGQTVEHSFECTLIERARHNIGMLGVLLLSPRCDTRYGATTDLLRFGFEISSNDQIFCPIHIKLEGR